MYLFIYFLQMKMLIEPSEKALKRFKKYICTLMFCIISDTSCFYGAHNQQEKFHSFIRLKLSDMWFGEDLVICYLVKEIYSKYKIAYKYKLSLDISTNIS